MRRGPRSQKLDNIIIRGYKSISFDRPVELKLSDVTILLGPNGAGKSNIVGFFRMLSHMMSGSFADYVEKSGTSIDILHYGPKITPSISAEFGFKGLGEGSDVFDDSYSFTLSNAIPDRLVVSNEIIGWKKRNEVRAHSLSLEPEYKESALIRNSRPASRSILRLLSSIKAYQFHDTSVEGPLRQPCPVETSNYLQSKGNNLPSFLYFLRENYRNEYDRILDYVRDVVPQFSDFYLEPKGNNVSLKWRDKFANDYVFSSYQFSDGSLRFIALATLLLQPEDTMPEIVVIDEPELGLHPYAISQLAEMIKDASLHAQILIATQSKDLVDCFSIENVSVVECENGSTTVNRLTEEQYRLWLEDYRISELWDKNVIGGRPQ